MRRPRKVGLSTVTFSITVCRGLETHSASGVEYETAQSTARRLRSGGFRVRIVAEIPA